MDSGQQVQTTGELTDPLDSPLADLGGRATRGGAMMVASEAAQVVVGFVATLVLARLLTPADFGLIAMVASIMGFVGTIRDFGLPFATMQRPRVSHAELSRVFWLNLKLALVMGLVLALLAPGIAWFYGEHKLIAITLALTAGSITMALSTVHLGLLRRQMRFTALMNIEFGGAAAGVVGGIVAALCGMGYWAIVVQSVTENVATAAAIVLVSSWLPSRRKIDDVDSHEGVNAIISYSKYFTYSRMVNYVGKNIDIALLGRFVGAWQTGLYQKAEQLANLTFQQFYSPAVSVSVASFSRLHNDPQRYRAYFRKALMGLFAVTAPLMIFVLVDTRPMILLLLGLKWVDAIPMGRALTLSMFAGSFIQIARWVNLAEGSTRRQFIWALISTPTLVAGVIGGLHWGAVGVAWGYSIATCVLVGPGLLYGMNGAVLKMSDVLQAVWRPVLMALLAGGGLLVVHRAGLNISHAFAQIVVNGAIYACIYFISWFVSSGGRKDVREMSALLRHFRTGPSSAVP